MGSFGPGVGSTLVTTNPTTTATITSGVTETPSAPSSSTARRVDVRGNRSMATHMAPMPIAIAGAVLMPGSPAITMPSTAPTSMAGKIGPPRKALSESPYIAILQHAEQHQGGHGVVRDVRHQLGQGVLAGEQHLGGAVVGDQLVDHRHDADDQRREPSVTRTRFRWTTGRSDSPTHRIAQPSSAATAPTTRAQAIRAIGRVHAPAVPRSGRARTCRGRSSCPGR